MAPRLAAPTGLLLVLACSCGDPALEPTVRLDHIAIVSGADQTGLEGHRLAHHVVARVVRVDGIVASDTIYAEVVSGSGSIAASVGHPSGAGGRVEAPDGTITVTWTLGPAGEPQTLRFYAVERATGRVVDTTVAATARPPITARVSLTGRVHTLEDTSPERLMARAWTAFDTVEAEVSPTGDFTLQVPLGALDSTIVVVGDELGDAGLFNPSVRVFPVFEHDLHLEVLLIPKRWTIKHGTYAGREVPVPLHLAMAPENIEAGGDGMFFIVVGWPQRHDEPPPRRALWTTAWPDDAFPIPVYFTPAGEDYDGRLVAEITAADSAVFWSVMRGLEQILGRDLFRPAVAEELEAIRFDDGTPARMGGIAVRKLAGPGLFATTPLPCLQWYPPPPFPQPRDFCDAVGPGRLVWAGVSLQHTGVQYAVTHEMLHALGYGHGCWTPTIIGSCRPVQESEYLEHDGEPSYHSTPTPYDVGYMELYRAVHARTQELRPHMGLVAALEGAHRMLLGKGPLPAAWLARISGGDVGLAMTPAQVSDGRAPSQHR